MKDSSCDRQAADRKYMSLALKEAARALEQDEVPVGAVIVDGGGKVLVRAHNRTLEKNDPTAHAEILAIREAAGRTGNYRLTGMTIYVTLEPCCMCAGAMVWARIARLVFGAADPKAGAAASLYRVLEDGRLNHRAEVVSGIRQEECQRLLQDFFRSKREKSW